MTDRIVENARDLDRLMRYLPTLPRPFTIKITDGRSRSADQNKLLWRWISDAARQRQGMSLNDIACEWKLLFGVPILCQEDTNFSVAWEQVELAFNHEQQLGMMNVIPVSSLLTVSQMKQYLDEIWHYNTAHGIELTDTEELRYGASLDRGVDRRDTRHGSATASEAKDRTPPGDKVP